jgi:Fe-S cluster biosynthesis and repair protein YggX
MNSLHFQKYLAVGDSRVRFKKMCLKSKNILFENEQIQIGCKIQPLYDIYSSTNHLLISLFVGNKTGKSIDSFQLEFKGTPNLALFVEEKNRSIRERTQYKEKMVVGCNNYEEEILLLMNFQSALATLKNIPLPLTLFSFCIFDLGETIPASILSQKDLQQWLEHRYEYIEEQDMPVSSPFFKKNLLTEVEKYFSTLTKICEGVYIGHFTTKTLINEYSLTLTVSGERSVKICLASNEYELFDHVFGNLRFLLE